MQPTAMLLFALLGFTVGLIGTLVGAGGGFLLVPILIFLMPNEPSNHITAISMAVVLGNAVSGTIAYARMRRVDFKYGIRFAMAAMPGAFLGAYATSLLPRAVFDRAMAGMLVVIAAYLLWRSTHPLPKQSDHDFRLDPAKFKQGCAVSAGVGFASSILGIGGGIIHVPALIYMLGYPVHIATATSHFVLALTSLAAVAEHVVHQSYAENFSTAIVMAVGAIAGAQSGARLSSRVKGPIIVRVLAVAQIIAGLRIITRG